MSKKTYRYIDGKMVMVRDTGRRDRLGPYIQPDIEGYESPIDGKWVEGRKARREDLKRSGSRPWEGLEQEKREADKVRAEWDRKTDQIAEKMAHRMWAEMPESKRKLFRYK